MRGIADYENAPLVGQAASLGNDCPHILVPLVLEDDKIFCTDQHSSWSFRVSARDRDQQIGTVVYWIRPFADHMIEAQVKLVECQVLLGFTCSSSGGILSLKNNLSLINSSKNFVHRNHSLPEAAMLQHVSGKTESEDAISSSRILG